MIIPPGQPPDRTITISQTSHSWISGQLARAWGNDIFSRFEPFEQMCYAAEQHDIGFLHWECQPTLNVKTGLPYTFEELPESLHLEIWRTGIFQLRPVCYYASLVVSLHFCNLCERFHQHPDNRAGVDQFLSEQKKFQVNARETLGLDPVLGPAITSELLAYHRDLIATWDLFSLELCRGRSKEFKLPRVPLSETKRVDVFLRELDHSAHTWEVDPWPFAVKSLTAICEGRVLTQTFTDAAELRSALLAADRTTVHFEFVPLIRDA